MDLDHRPGLSRIQAMHFALALIESIPAETSGFSWSDFDNTDYSRYQPFWDKDSEFLYHAAMVVAARTRSANEESRWKLMALFQTAPPGPLKAEPIRAFTMFTGVGYISKDEIKRRGRDFASKFPEHGWTWVTLARLWNNFGDNDLKELALKEAASFSENDPRLKEEIDRFTRVP